MAPEQLEGISSTTSSDIFYLGAYFAMIQAVLCTEAGVKPWNIAKQRQQCFFAVDKLAEGRFALNTASILDLLENMRLGRDAIISFSNGLSHSTLQDLVRAMFTLDPSKRPDADALCGTFGVYEATTKKSFKPTSIRLVVSAGGRTLTKYIDVSEVTTDTALFRLLQVQLKRASYELLCLSWSFFYYLWNIQIFPPSSSFADVDAVGTSMHKEPANILVNMDDFSDNTSFNSFYYTRPQNFRHFLKFPLQAEGHFLLDLLTQENQLPAADGGNPITMNSNKSQGHLGWLDVISTQTQSTLLVTCRIDFDRLNLSFLLCWISTVPFSLLYDGDLKDDGAFGSAFSILLFTFRWLTFALTIVSIKEQSVANLVIKDIQSTRQRRTLPVISLHSPSSQKSMDSLSHPYKPKSE